MNRRSMWSTLTLFLFAISALEVWQFALRTPALATAQTQTVEGEFIVEGMHCASCPVTVRVAAERVDGVKKARASVKEGKAWVTFDPAVTSAKAIADAITKAGYPARPIEKKPEAGKP